MESDIVTCATSFFWWEEEIETEQLQGTVVDKIEIGKHAIKLSERDTVVVSVSVLYRVPCARYA